MAEVNFYLKNPKDTTQESLIYLFFSYDGKRLKYSTGEKVAPKAWLKTKQRVKKSYTGSFEINEYLNELQSDVQRLYRQFKIRNEAPSPSELRVALDTRLNENNLNHNSFFQVYDMFLTQSQMLLADVTIQKYGALRAHLKEFEGYNHSIITFEGVDQTFYDKLVNFFYEEKQLLDNTVGKYIAMLKSFLNWATERKLNSQLDYKKFKVFKQESDIVYIEEQELDQLYNFDFNSARLARVRDMFCFCCYTGLRFSDLKQMSPDSVNNDTLVFTTQKTKETLYVPLSSKAEAIIAKYIKIPGFLPVISNPKMNQYLKELGKKAGITSPVTITRFSGKDRIVETKPKYQFLTCHTARRTFITLSLEKNVRAEVVMAIVGHKQYKTMQRYLKITDRVKKRELLSAWG